MALPGLPDDVSPWALLNFTPGSSDMQRVSNLGPVVFLKEANATTVKLINVYGSLEWQWIFIGFIGLVVSLTIACIVRGLLRSPDFARDRKINVTLCCGCVGAKVSLDDVLNSAEKVLDTLKFLSAIFIFLTPSAIAQSICDTPKALLAGGLSGYNTMTPGPTIWSGVRVDTVRYLSILKYTPEQYHAVVALMSVTVDYRYFFALYVIEVCSMIMFVGSWGAVRKERWAFFYAAVAFMLTIVWAAYETQMHTLTTLLDSGEMFLCTVPFLSVYTRAFAVLHFVIASYYFGLWLGRSPWVACWWCTCWLGPAPSAKASSSASSREIGVSSRVNSAGAFDEGVDMPRAAARAAQMDRAESLDESLSSSTASP